MPNKHHLGQKRSDRRFLLTSGVALHHVSAKDGMMSRPVWEDGTSWAGNELLWRGRLVRSGKGSKTIASEHFWRQASRCHT